MRRSKRLDLDCLIFDLRNGRDFQPLSLYPGVWGRSCNPDLLEALLRSAKSEKWLRVTLVAAHLFYSKSTPEWAWPWLLQNAPGVMGADLATLERARWMRFYVPVADERSSDSLELMAGVGLGLPLVPPASIGAFAPNSVAALEVADRLVRQKWGEGCCFGLVCPSVIGPVICGPSLGLPAYLAAAACHEGLVDLQVLATGGLDDSGRVLPVRYVQSKLKSAKVTPKLFIYPQGNESPVSDVECVPVSHVSEALEVVACNKPGLGLKIAQAEKAMQSGKGLASEICSFRSEMAFWIRRNRDRVAAGLASDAALMELVKHVEIWCDSTRQNEPDLGNAVLECLPLEFVERVSREDAALGWVLCVLQMDRANHGGQLEEFKRWRLLADGLRPRISESEDAARHLALHYVQVIIGDRHNRYVFSENIPEDEYAGPEVKEMQRAFERLRARGLCREDTRLGKYYGTLGQNLGFCGPGLLKECLRYLDLAIACFCADSPQSQDERNRDVIYKVFALSSAGQTDDAFVAMQKIPGLWQGGKWNLKAMNQYQIHALLRIHVDQGCGVDLRLWQRIADVWQAQSKRSHPWQLITYNLGLLAPDKEHACRMLMDSVTICQSQESGPTIQAMALLPLAQLHTIDRCLPEMETCVRRVLASLYWAGLSREHFFCVLHNKNIDEILLIVQMKKNYLFPYMYH